MTDNAHPQPFEFGNHTDIGRIRQANEDYLGYFNTLNGHIFVVCDGMGGHVGGATASQMAVDSVRAFFQHRYYDYPHEAMRQALLYANGQIFAASQQNPQLRGMGTTCVLVMIRKDEVWFAHVGDSRIYYLTNGRLERITRDHSYVQQLIDQGLLTEAEAENHPRRNELTRALGTSREVIVDVCSQPLIPVAGDVIMLCTDGLTGLLSDDAIRLELQGNGSAQRRAMRLVERANESGGYDNITVQLIQFQTQEQPIAEIPAPVVLPPAPVVETPAAVTPTALHKAPESPQIPEMPKRTKTSKPSTKSKGPDVALIVLGVLAVIVVILFVSGSKYMSDKPVENSELISGTVDSTSVTEDEVAEEEVTEPVKPVRNPNAEAKAKPATPAKSTNSTPTNPVNAPAGGKIITHTVSAGETFSSIARRYNLTNQTLKKLNPSITNEGADIKSGVTKLKVRVKAVHTVGPGDILNVVSRKYNVPKELIMTANAKTTDRANRGEELIIPFAEKQ